MNSAEAAKSSKNNDLIQMTADVVTAFVANNSVVRQDIPALIENVHKAFAAIQNGPKDIKIAEPLQPRLLIKKTITPDYLISLEDGRQYRTLKRHLRGVGLTPEQYRKKWGLPADYPIAVGQEHGAWRREEEDCQEVRWPAFTRCSGLMSSGPALGVASADQHAAEVLAADGDTGEGPPVSIPAPPPDRGGCGLFDPRAKECGCRDSTIEFAS
jgi:predicted transcriptional regulator